MKLSILQENLTQAIATASRSASVKATLPILNHLLLTTESGRLKISATNLEVGVNIVVGAKVEEEGSLAVPARVLHDLVSSLPPGKLDISVEKGNLHLLAGNIEANIAGIEGSEYPAIPTFIEAEAINLPVTGLTEAVEATAYATAVDESRPVLAGIFWQVKDQTMLLVATDGYRLAKKEVQLPNKMEKNWEVVVPGRSLQEVAKIITELSGRGETPDEIKVVLNTEQNQISFQLGPVELTSRLVEGTYPLFSNIIPKDDASVRGVFAKDELIRAVRLAAIFARDLGSVIKFKIGESGLELSANTNQVGDETTTIQGDISGEEVSVAFNSRYLLDALAHLSGNQISFEIKSNLNPGVLRSVGDTTLLVLIMPVRVQS